MTRDEVIALQKRADALGATIATLRELVTTDHESKQSFIEAVRKVLGDDPDDRVAAIEARARKADPALRLVADIRFALGDDGKRMQDELVEYCKEMRRDAERYRYAVSIGGNECMNWLNIYDDWNGQDSFTDAVDAAMKDDGVV